MSVASKYFSTVESYSDGPCLASMEQDWDNVGPVELHIHICTYMIFFSRRKKQSFAIPMRRNISVSLPPSWDISEPTYIKGRFFHARVIVNHEVKSGNSQS